MVPLADPLDNRLLMGPTSPVQKQRLLLDHPYEGTLARGYRYPGMSLMHHRELMLIRDSDRNGISQRAGNGFEQEPPSPDNAWSAPATDPACRAGSAADSHPSQKMGSSLPDGGRLTWTCRSGMDGRRRCALDAAP